MIANIHPQVPLILNNCIFEVIEHPYFPGHAFVQEGRKSWIYKLREKYSGESYALKVFKPAFRDPQVTATVSHLKKYESVPGMRVSQRFVLNSNDIPEPPNLGADLHFAIMMPWIDGLLWSVIIMKRMSLSNKTTLSLASKFSELLKCIETNGDAHCDIAGENVIVDLSTKDVELVDVEDMYSENLSIPRYVPAGGDGYQHRLSRIGQWGRSADRFAGAVLLAEIITWHRAEIRDVAFGEHYFSPYEMQNSQSERYYVLRDALKSISSKMAELFERVWYSGSLDECPNMYEWVDAIKELEIDALSKIENRKKHEKHTTLHYTLVNNFDLEELRNLCFVLNVDYDSLRGEGKSAKARELILYFARRGKIDLLIDAICKERGNVI